MGTIRIGVSGWNYDAWRGDFYPEDLRRRDELAYAARAFDSIEINGTFYSLRSPHDFRRWRDAAPRGFRYAVKGSRFITHNKKLRGVEAPLANFFASGLLELEDALGPILWQLPDSVRFSADRLETFLDALPKDTETLARHARRHDDRVEQASTDTDRNRRVRHVLEPRHDSFFTPECVRLLRRHGVALAFSDAEDWPYTEELTAGFVYLRLHGPGRTYASSYGEDALREWADRIRSWKAGDEPDDARRITDRVPPRRKERDVYVYFDNDQHAYAPANARRLREILGV